MSARSRWKRRGRYVRRPGQAHGPGQLDPRHGRRGRWRARRDHGRRADQCADHRGARAGCRRDPRGARGGEEKESGMVPVQCLVSRFEVQDGVMTTRALVLETSDSTVTGSGTIDLGQETLDLTLLAHPKDASVLSASTPVAIKGTFRDPRSTWFRRNWRKGAGRPRARRRVAGDRRNPPVHRDRRGGRRQLRGAHEGGRWCAARHSERQARQFERALSTLQFMVAPCLESLTTRSAGAGARRRAHAGAAYVQQNPSVAVGCSHF